MTGSLDAERILDAFLAPEADQLPDRVLDAAFTEIARTPQRRALRVPWRFRTMPISLRLAAAALVGVLAVGAAIFAFGQVPDVGPPTTPSPSPTASADTSSASPTASLLDTSGWIAYTSERYGFDIKRPPNWNENQSTRAWQMSDAANFPAEGTEDFTYQPAEDLGVRVSAWSVAVTAGTTLDAWLQEYCTASGTACPGVLTAANAITLDGHDAVSLAGVNQDSRIYALINDRVYSVTAWRAENDPAVAEFGGGRRLVESFVSTMTLRPGGPVPDAVPPALTGSFTSDLYGYSIDFPSAFWTATAGTALWVTGVNPGDDGWSDTFLPPSTSNGFRAASAKVPDGVNPNDSWIDLFFNNGGECGPARSTLENVVIDGFDGKIRTSCEEVEATVIADGRLYIFTLFLDDVPPYSTAGGRALFEAMIASVQLTPATAVSPSPTPS